MATVGTLTIEMAADVARIRKDMGAIRGHVDSTMTQIVRAAKMATAALGAIGVGLSVAALSGFIRRAIDAADETAKLAQKAGIATKDVAGLQIAFRQAGLEGGALQTSMARLSQGIARGNDALRAMGIETRNIDGSFRSTRQVLGDIAERFSGYRDGVEKTALAMELFGRTGAELVPLLNGGAAALDEFDAMAERFGLTIDEKTAKSAELFNDTLDTMQTAMGGIAQRVAADLLPTLTALAGEFLRSMTEGDRLKTIADALAKTFRVLYIAGLGVVEVFSTVGKTVGSVVAAIMEGMKGNFGIAWSILKDMKTEIAGDWTATADAMDRAWNKSGDSAVQALTAVVVSAKRAAPEMEKVGKKGADAFAALASKIEAIDTGFDADFAKNLNLLRDAYEKGRISFERYLALAEKYIRSQKFYRDEIARTAKELDDYFEAEEKARKAKEDSIKSVREMIEQIEFETEALQLTNAERETAIKLREMERLGIEKGSAAYEELAKRIREAVAGKAAVEASIEYRKNAEEEWARTWDQVAQSFTDALMQGGRSVKEYLIGLFRTMVLRPILLPFVGGVLGAVGGPAAAGGSGGMSALSGASSAANLLGMAGTFGSFASTGFMASVTQGYGASAQAVQALWANGATTQAAGMGAGMIGAGVASFAAGQALNKFISSGYRISKGMDTAQTIATVVAAAINPIAGVVVGAASGAINRLFGRKLKDVGIEGTFSSEGFAGNQYEFYKGGLFRSDKTKRRALDADLQIGLSEQFQSLQYATIGMAATLGMATEGIEGYTSAVKISLKGLKEEAAQARIAEEFARMGNEMADLVTGLGEFSRRGETSAETLTRLSTSLIAVNQAFDTLGLTLAQGLVGGDFSSRLLDAMGGADPFAQAVGTYFEGFYTEAERIATITRQTTEALAMLGLAMPESRDGFRAMVEAARDAADPQMLAALLQIAPAFASITQSSDDLARAAMESAAQIEQAAQQAEQAIAQERARLERQLMEAMEDRAGLRALDLSALDASNRALQERIWAIQDAREAEAKSAQAIATQMQQAAQQMQAVAQQRYQIETRLLTLQGNTAELRARELAQLDPSNRALQEQVWALEDQQQAAQAAAQAAIAAAQRTAQIRSEWARLGDGVLDEVRRIRGELYGSSTVGYAQAQSAFAIAAVQAKAGDKQALEALPELSRQMLDLAEANAGSLLELQRMRGYTAAALLDSGEAALRRGGVVSMSAAPGGVRQTSDPDLLAAIAEMRAELARIAETNEKSAPYIERTARILDDAQRGKAPLSTEAAP